MLLSIYIIGIFKGLFIPNCILKGVIFGKTMLKNVFLFNTVHTRTRVQSACFWHITKCFESAIAKMRGENKPFKIMFYIRRDSNLETQYYMSLSHAFEQQPIDSAVISCVPFV